MDELLRHCLRELSFDGDLGCPVERLRDFIVDFYAKGFPQNTDDHFCAFIWSLVVQQPTVIVGTVPNGITSQVWIAPQNSQKRKAKAKGEEIVETAPPTLNIVPNAASRSLDDLKAQYGDQLRVATNSDTTYAALTGTHIRFPKMSPMVYTALQIITRGRENGITVVELGQRSTYDQKTCFYLVKQLTELDLIVKVRRGGVGTHFCIHKYFFERSELWREIREEESRATAALEAEEVADVPEEDGEQPAAPKVDLDFTPIDARHISSLPLLKARVIKLLKASKNQMHASNNMLVAIGFAHPTKTDRRFFTARMRELVDERLIECVYVAAKRRSASASTGNGIKCYRLPSTGASPEAQAAGPPLARPDDDPEDRGGVKFNTTIHKQILSLIEESGKTGMTLSELTLALNQFDRRTTELILTRAEKYPPPAHLIDLGIACLMETSGRERRNRYYTLASYEALIAQEGFDKTSSGYSDIDREHIGGFYPLSASLFYTDTKALFAHQDSDLRALNKVAAAANGSKPKGRLKVYKNPLLPDGTVKKGRPKKVEDGDGDAPKKKRKRKQAAEGDDESAEKSPPKKKARLDPVASVPTPADVTEDAAVSEPAPAPAPAPKRRGRLPKNPPPPVAADGALPAATDSPSPAPKKRGRPKKDPNAPPKPRGRPRKVPKPVNDPPVQQEDDGATNGDKGESVEANSNDAMVVETEALADDGPELALPSAKRAKVSSQAPEDVLLDVDVEAVPLIATLPPVPPSIASPIVPLVEVEMPEETVQALSPPNQPSGNVEMQVESEKVVQVQPVEDGLVDVQPVEVEPVAPTDAQPASAPVTIRSQQTAQPVRQQKVNVSTLRRDNELFRVLEMLGGIANTQTKELFDTHMSLLSTLAEAGEPASAPPNTNMDRRTAIAGYNNLEMRGRVKQLKTTLTTTTGLVRPANIVYLPHISDDAIAAFLLEQGRNMTQFPPSNVNPIVVDAHTEYGSKSRRQPTKASMAGLILNGNRGEKGKGKGKDRVPNAQRADQLFALSEDTIREALLTERTTFGQVYGFIPAKMLRVREMHRYCLSAFLKGSQSPGIVSTAHKIASFQFFYSELPLGLYCAVVACVDGNDELSQYLATEQGWSMPVKDLPPSLHSLLQISRARGRGRVLELLDVLRCLGLVQPLKPAEDPQDSVVTCPSNGDLPTSFREDLSEGWTSDTPVAAPEFWRWTESAPVFYWKESASAPRFLCNMPITSDEQATEYWDYLKTACLGSKQPLETTSDDPPPDAFLTRVNRKVRAIRRRVAWAEGYSFTWHQAQYLNRRIEGAPGIPPLDGSDDQLRHVAGIVSAPVDVVRAFYDKSLAVQAERLEKATRRLQREIAKKTLETQTKASLVKKAAEALAVREAKWDALVAEVYPDPLPEEKRLRLKRIRTAYLQSTGALVGKWQKDIAQALHDSDIALAPNPLQKKKYQWKVKAPRIPKPGPASSQPIPIILPSDAPPVVVNPPEKSVAALVAGQGPAIVDKTRTYGKKKKGEPEPEPDTEADLATTEPTVTEPSTATSAGPRSRFHWNRDYEELLKDAYVIVNSRCRSKAKIDYGMIKQVFPASPKTSLRAHVRALRDAPANATYLTRLEEHWHQLWIKYRGSTWLPDENVASANFDLAAHIEFLRRHVDKNAIRVGFAEDDAMRKNIIPATIEMLTDQFTVVEPSSGAPAWDFMFGGLVDDSREKRALRQALCTRRDDLAFGTEDLTDDILMAEAALKLTMGTASASYDATEASRILHDVGESAAQAATKNLLSRGILSKRFRNPNSQPGRMLKISELNSNATSGAIQRDTFNDAIALEDISVEDDTWREWPLLATDGDIAALVELVSEDKVHFKIDTTQAQAARELVDWNSKKADDDHIETAILYRFHDVPTPSTPSPIQTPIQTSSLEPIPVETAAQHEVLPDGTPACCKRVNAESVIDCVACIEEECESLSAALDSEDRDILLVISDAVAASGAKGITKEALLVATGLPRETFERVVGKMTDCTTPLVFWAGYSSLVLVASVHSRAWTVAISPEMRVFPRRWLDMTGNKLLDRWQAALRAVMGVLIFHPGTTQAQLRWRLRSVYDRQEIYDILQYLSDGGWVERCFPLFCSIITHMRSKQIWNYLPLPSKAKLVWERLTFSRLTTLYALFSLTHFAVQIAFQIQAFSINANAASFLYNIALEGNATNSSFPAVAGDEIRMCAQIPLTLDTNNCTVVYDGTPNTNNHPLNVSLQLALANASSALASASSSSVLVSSSQALSSSASVSASSLSTSASASGASQSASASAKSASASFASRITKVVLTETVTTSAAAESATTFQSIDIRRAAVLPQVKVFSDVDQTTLVNITGWGYDNYPIVLDKSCMWSLNWPVSILDNTKREDIVFIAFQFWVLGMSLVALLNESMPHMFASLLTHVLATAWSGFQISNTAAFRSDFEHYITDGACHGVPTLLPTYWAARAQAEYPIMALNAVSLIVSSILTWKLVKLFGWQTFKRVGASLTIKRVYHLVLIFSIVVQLGLFFMGATVSLFLDQLINGWAGHLAWYSFLYKIMFILTGILLIPWITSGWYSVRHEKRWGMILFLGISLWYLTGWAVMFLSTTFRWTFETWNFFAIVSSASVFFSLVAFILAIICRYNFGKGLVRYLSSQEPLPGDEFERVTSRIDEEKVSFPTTEKPVPTYSATFGSGPEFRPSPQLGPRFFNSAAEPFESRTNSANSSPIAAPMAALTRTTTADSYQSSNGTRVPPRNSGQSFGSLNSYYDYSGGNSGHARQDSESQGTTTIGTKRWVIDD
uniref:B-block binding subunit of TFIIIC domain-containing protein n=1 Tax=Mycena chlorophos TaxID=658473 RepID=A0ABQ0KXJ6_MYCCL|nr:predicted protein [Mycena chlorophos]